MKKEIYPVCRTMFCIIQRNIVLAFIYKYLKRKIESKNLEVHKYVILTTITYRTNSLIYLTNIILLPGFKHDVFWGESKKKKICTLRCLKKPDFCLIYTDNGKWKLSNPGKLMESHEKY